MMNKYWLLLVLFFPLITFGQATGDYRSNVVSGSWSTPGSWQTFDGVSWITAVASPTDADGIITIRTGHTITITSDLVIDDTTIDTGGAVTLSSGINLDFPGFLFADVFTINGTFNNNGNFNLGVFSNVQVNGTFNNNQGAQITNSAADYFFFNAGSVYNHRYTTSEGEIPFATWDITSTCLISGFTSNSNPPLNLGQVFGNFTWGLSSYNGTAAFINLGGALTDVAGDLRVTATGTTAAKSLRFASTGQSGFALNIGGSLRLDGGTVSIVVGTISPTTINIAQDYSQSLANVVLTQTTGNVTVNVGGSFSKTGGTLSRLTSGVATFNFNGGISATQNYSYAGTAISSAINFSIENGSRLNVLSENNIMGAGSFTLNAGATLGVGSSNGLVTGTSSGNIRVSGARNYIPNGNIIYNGATQNLGNEWGSTGALNGVAVNLEISGGTVVTNNNIGSTSLVGVLSLTNGRLNIGNSNTLTIQGIFNSTASGLIGGSATSSLSFSGSGAMGTIYFAPSAQSLNNFTIGRTGTLNLGTDLMVEGSLNLSFGSLNFSNRALSINGGSITSAGTGLMSNSSSSLSFGGSTFSGSVPFSGAGNQLSTLTFATPGGVFNWNSNVTIIGNVVLTAGTVNHTSGLTMGTNSTFNRSGGSFLVNDPDVVTRFNVTYTGSVTTGLELPSTSNELNNLTVNSSGPVTLDKDITVNGNVNLLGSTLQANGFDITLASTNGTWTRNGGAFSGGSGILTVAGTYSIVAPSSAPNYTNITINSGGSLTLPTGNLNITGNIVNNGTLNRSTSTINFNGNTAISGSSATTLNNVTIGVSGTLMAPAATTLGINGNWINTGTFNHNNGTVAFGGTTAITGAAASNFFNVNLTGTLTAPSVSILGIAGNFSNGGTFNHNNGTVAFNGTVASQSITGSALTLNNMNVSNPITPGVSINNTTRLNGICTLSSGAFFDADGSGSGIFIVSSSSQIAGGRIAALPNPTNFTGQVTIERYIHGKTGGDYRYLSMPITTNANIGVWKNFIYVTGNFSDRSTNADNANIVNSGNTNPSVFTYNSTTQAYVGVSGAGGTTASVPVSSRVGYSAYDFNNGPVVASYRGTIERGNVPITISNTLNNYNLIPNPYPSPIDWDNVTKTNVNNAMYLRADNNVFSSYVGGIATNAPFVGWTGEVAVGQSFFVTSSGSGTTLTLAENNKTNNSFYFLRENSPQDYFRIHLIAADGTKDESVIRFAQGTSDEFDSEYDALKMNNGTILDPFAGNNPYVNISTYLESPDKQYAINTMGRLRGPKIVRLNIADGVEGTYTMDFSEISTLSEGYNIVLVDTYLHRETDISDGYSHEFSINTEELSYGNARFYLRINGAPASNLVTGVVDKEMGIQVFPNPVTDKLQIELTEDQQVNLKSIGLINVLGTTVISSEESKDLLEPGVKIIDMRGFSSGVYLLNIQCGDSIISTRIIKK